MNYVPIYWTGCWSRPRHSPKVLLLRALAPLFIGFWLTTCWAHPHEGKQFNSVDITNALCCRDFRLSDQNGRVRTIEDFRGKVVVLAFGYTHCPDVCPTTLAHLAQARRALHSDGKDVQVIFVTLDPKRDTAEVLRDYVAAFDPTFIGLRGSETAIAKVAKDFRIIFDKEDGKENTREYTVYHMTGTYVFDKAGRARLFAPTDSPDLLVKDLQALLSGG